MVRQRRHLESNHSHPLTCRTYLVQFYFLTAYIVTASLEPLLKINIVDSLLALVFNSVVVPLTGVSALTVLLNAQDFLVLNAGATFADFFIANFELVGIAAVGFLLVSTHQAHQGTRIEVAVSVLAATAVVYITKQQFADKTVLTQEASLYNLLNLVVAVVVFRSLGKSIASIAKDAKAAAASPVVHAAPVTPAAVVAPAVSSPVAASAPAATPASEDAEITFKKEPVPEPIEETPASPVATPKKTTKAAAKKATPKKAAAKTEVDAENVPVSNASAPLTPPAAKKATPGKKTPKAAAKPAEVPAVEAEKPALRTLRVDNPGPKSPGVGGVKTRLRTRVNTVPNW